MKVWKSRQINRPVQPDNFSLTKVGFLDIHLFLAPSKRAISRRREEPGEMIIVLNGIYHARGEDPQHRKEIVAKAGEVVFWPPRARRIEESDPARPLKCLAIYFDWAHPDPQFPTLLRDSFGIIRTLADRLLQVHASPLKIPWMVRDAYLIGILAEYRHTASAQLEKTLVGQVTRYTEENLHKFFTLDDLSAHVGLDKAYFIRKFKGITRMTPMRYVCQQRAQRALGILSLHPRRSLHQIASFIGVSNDLQVRRLLQRYCQVSVRELRRLKSISPQLRKHPDERDPIPLSTDEVASL